MTISNISNFRLKENKPQNGTAQYLSNEWLHFTEDFTDFNTHKIQKHNNDNKQHQSFDLNGHILGFYPRTRTLELPSIPSFILLSIPSFMRPSVHPFRHPFGRSFVRSFVLRSFVRSFVCPSYRQFVRSSVRPSIRRFIHSSVRPFFRLFPYSLPGLLRPDFFLRPLHFQFIEMLHNWNNPLFLFDILDATLRKLFCQKALRHNRQGLRKLPLVIWVPCGAPSRGCDLGPLSSVTVSAFRILLTPGKSVASCPPQFNFLKTDNYPPFSYFSGWAAGYPVRPSETH